MIVREPVLERYAPDGFDLWPVAESKAFDFLPLSGELSLSEVGTAVLRIAGCNDIDPDGDRPPRPAAAVDSFLHGLLTFDTLFAAGGLRVTDTSTGVTFLPGCRDGLEGRRDWHQLVTDGTLLGCGETVRLTVNAEPGDRPALGSQPPWTVIVCNAGNTFVFTCLALRRPGAASRSRALSVRWLIGRAEMPPLLTGALTLSWRAGPTKAA